ncbi:ribosomal protein S18-alanine N-acetyltransferase [Vallitalea pronyensis]|uniref:[Ribosomal protein bS18]-alanine N-acetyltransferase n=1 Tax=Vallitalea pronyensis TaxID=1348613 RepID=A0A8J8MN11_9FIRM|nr:ribosomal protein S18-alanine N-acetyltransferase [Vallitalea pronyensis]QUI24917.1 ribosomal protein S18-alanine N-acetyltransferase [Vallitalea pronyensis]
MYLVREMELADIKQVHAIEVSTFTTPWSEASFREELEGNKHSLYVVIEEEGEILAYGGLWSIVGEGHITNIAVKKGFRGRGFGKKVTETLIEEGKGKGLRAFTLEVRRSNKIAISLYEGLGFVKAGLRLSFYDKPKEDAIIMWKRLR